MTPVGFWRESTLAGSTLQASLAAGTANGDTYPGHHPLTCPGPLALHGDGTLECPHHHTEPADGRTRMAVDQSVAFLLIEMAHATLE